MGSDRLADDFSDFIDAAFADELSKQGDGCGREVAQGVSKTRKRKRATPDVDSTCGSKVCKGGKHNKSNQNTTALQRFASVATETSQITMQQALQRFAKVAR
jgi:hypothetical protein